MPYRSFFREAGGGIHSDLAVDEISAALEDSTGLLWVDIGETDGSDARFLESVMGFHPLAVEDCLTTDIHSTKIEQYGDYVFVIAHGINYSVDSHLVETVELALFIGPNFVVSNHNFHVDAVATVVDRLERSDVMTRGADFLAHALLDALIDDIAPTLDRMSAVIDQIEAEVLESPTTDTLEAIMRTKRSALRILRIIVPQRDTVSRISRGEFQVIRADNRAYYANVYDHLVRISDRTQSLRELADGAVSTYFAAVGFRQNETMKTLSVVASVFLPLTLLAGIYGMNFENMPELGWRWMYFVVLGVIVTSLVAVFWLYWGRRWLQQPTHTAIQLWRVPLREARNRSIQASSRIVDGLSGRS